MVGRDVHAVTAGCEDCYYVWTGDFEPAQYVSVYILDGEQPALIDTGTGANVEVILDALDQLAIAPGDLAAIVLTHVHLDHAGGAGRLAERCPAADIYVHEDGASHLVDPERLWAGTKRAVGDQIQSYAEPRPVPKSRVNTITDGDRIDLGDRSLTVHEAPGHAFHQVVLQDENGGGVFTGDAAGVKTPGLDQVRESSPPPGFDLEGCLGDIELIQGLDPTMLYLAHFGAHEPDPLLETYADVLERWVESVAETRESLSDESVIEQFARERAPVEAWGALKAREETRMNVRGVLQYLDE